jgi:signal transduction histidine kinase
MYARSVEELPDAGAAAAMQGSGASDSAAAVDAALVAWRGRATQIGLVAVAAAHVPVIVLAWLGHGPPMTPLSKAIGIAIYLLVAGAALLPRVDYRRRLIVCFLAAYPAAAIASLAFPDGPYAQGSVVTLPIFVLVLLGRREAVIAVLASAAIILSAPLIHAHPDIVRAFRLDAVPVANPPGLLWFRAAVKTASLLGLMVLLDRFHCFLIEAVTRRIAAQRKMEREMRERHRLEREIAAVGDGERRRLGQELHDGVCQEVTAALLRCQGLERRLQRGATPSAVEFQALSSLLSEAIDEAHNVARGLCPLDSDPDALAPAIRALTRRTQGTAGFRCEFMAAGDVRVPDQQAAQHLYRIAQEALSNAVRHAKADRIAVELRGSDGELTLQIHDNGAGMPPAPSVGGMGLRTMAYRAHILEGELRVAPAPGGGTLVTCRVPRPSEVAGARQKSGENPWIAAT